MQSWGVVCQPLLYQEAYPWSVLWREMGKIRSLTGVETDVKVNPTGYLSVRNVSMHSLLIRYRIVCGPALSLWGRSQNRAKMMTEVIAALIAPLRVCRVNAGTFIHWRWKDVTAGHGRKPVCAPAIHFYGLILAGHCDADWACHQRQSSNWQAKSNLPHRHQLHIVQWWMSSSLADRYVSVSRGGNYCILEVSELKVQLPTCFASRLFYWCVYMRSKV